MFIDAERPDREPILDKHLITRAVLSRFLSSYKDTGLVMKDILELGEVWLPDSLKNTQEPATELDVVAALLELDETLLPRTFTQLAERLPLTREGKQKLQAFFPYFSPEEEMRLRLARIHEWLAGESGNLEASKYAALATNKGDFIQEMKDLVFDGTEDVGWEKIAKYGFSRPSEIAKDPRFTFIHSSEPTIVRVNMVHYLAFKLITPKEARIAWLKGEDSHKEDESQNESWGDYLMILDRRKAEILGDRLVHESKYTPLLAVQIALFLQNQQKQLIIADAPNYSELEKFFLKVSNRKKNELLSPFDNKNCQLIKHFVDLIESEIAGDVLTMYVLTEDNPWIHSSLPDNRVRSKDFLYKVDFIKIDHDKIRLVIDAEDKQVYRLTIEKRKTPGGNMQWHFQGRSAALGAILSDGEQSTLTESQVMAERFFQTLKFPRPEDLQHHEFYTRRMSLIAERILSADTVEELIEKYEASQFDMNPNTKITFVVHRQESGKKGRILPTQVTYVQRGDSGQN